MIIIAFYNDLSRENHTLIIIEPNLISIALGFYNSYLNIQQIDNNSIMAELNKQDKIYFERIIKLLEEIKGAKNDDE